MKNYTLIEFIEELVIPDLEKMAAQQLHYYAFSVICQAIEVMGAATDSSDLGDFSLSEQRFTNALPQFFKDIRYRNNQRKFFKFLRGPLIHQLRPGEGFFLASALKDNIDPAKHLERHESGATLLIIEPFLGDFKNAFAQFKRFLIERRAPAPQRFQTTFLAVSTLALEYGKTTWDPSLSQTVTLTPFATGSAFPATRFEDDRKVAPIIRKSFPDATPEIQRQIAITVFSTLTLKDRKLTVSQKPPFEFSG